MAYIDTAEHQREFNKFLAGEVFYSPAPVELARVAIEDVGAMHRYPEYAGYRQWSPSRPGSLVVRFVALPAFDRATDIFCTAAGVPSSDVGVRRGRFSKFGRQLRSGVNIPHIDTVEGVVDDTIPVYTTSMVVGPKGRAFVGMARAIPDGDGEVTCLEGEEIELEEGVVNRFSPLSVHWESERPIIPQNRYFWRVFHDLE